MGGAYDTSGCEHFGVSTSGNPTRTVYRWLIADPVHPGFLIPAGTHSLWKPPYVSSWI
jgi:hypothetical protein